MKHVFILNPAAGKKSDPARAIHDYFARHLIHDAPAEYDILYTKSVHHATQLAREVSQDPKGGVLYAMGGDGTANEVLNGLVGSNWQMGILPQGTGNDFISALTKDIPRDQLLHETLQGEAVAMDIGQVNDRYFLNICSIGLDATINAKAGQFRRHPLISNRFSYIAGIIASLSQLKPISLTVSVGSEQRAIQVLMITLANGTTYGGGFVIAPQAKLDDGLLEVMEIAPLSFRQLLKHLPMLKKGTHLASPKILCKSLEQITITSPVAFDLNIDGEGMRLQRADFTMHKGTLSLRLPKKVAENFKAAKADL